MHEKYESSREKSSIIDRGNLYKNDTATENVWRSDSSNDGKAAARFEVKKMDGGLRMIKVTDMKVNHIANPMGYDLSTQTFSWKYEVSATSAAAVPSVSAACVQVAADQDFTEMVYDSGMRSDISNKAFELDLKLSPRTRYFWRVKVGLSYGADHAQGDHTEVIVSDAAWFETGKLEEEWTAQWIAFPVSGMDDESCREAACEGARELNSADPAAANQKENQESASWEPVEADIEHITERPASPVARKKFRIEKTVESARLYVTGLGLYECYLNGAMQNDGYFQPGFNHYNYWLQYQTMDITDALNQGENELRFLIGDGWYKGRFGVNGGFENNFGTGNHLLCEIRIRYEDGSEEVIGSDETFEYALGPVLFSSIYDGEIFDARKLNVFEAENSFEKTYDAHSTWRPAILKAPEKIEKLTERFSLPVVVKNKLKPAALLIGPDDEKILDMGQNMTGWLVFKDKLEAGQTVTLRFAELLKDGKLCMDNLLTAKNTAFVYTSAGTGRNKNECGSVRPHFTYFGFRYVQLEGFEGEIDLDDFEGWNIYSDLAITGDVKTGNADVNQLISNALWSQRDNFLEHPTDCPQRAERLGWTGDAQIYYKTASYFMDTTAFFRKYIRDVNEEQSHRDGLVPFIIPKIKGRGFSDPNAVECSAAWSDVATVVPWMMYVYYGDKNLLREQYVGMKSWVSHMIQEDEKNGGKYLYQTGFHFGDWLALDNPEPGPFGKTDPFYIASAYYMYSTELTAKAAEVLGYDEDAKAFNDRAARIKAAILDTYFDVDGICKIDTQTAYVLAIYMDIADGKAALKNGAILADKIRSNHMHLDTGFVGTPYLCLALTKAKQYDVAVELLLQKEIPGWLGEVKLGATTIWEAWDALDEKGYLTGDASLNHYAYGSVVEWIFSDVCGLKPMAEAPGFEKVLMTPHPTKKLGSAEASLDTAFGQYKISWDCEGEVPHVKVKVPYGGSATLRWQGESLELAAGEYAF